MPKDYTNISVPKSTHKDLRKLRELIYPARQTSMVKILAALIQYGKANPKQIVREIDLISSREPSDPPRRTRHSKH